MNEVVRAVRTGSRFKSSCILDKDDEIEREEDGEGNSGLDGGTVKGRETFVMKYAAPWIAAVGPEAPFGVFRQTIEARALSLFTPQSGFGLDDICSRSTVVVPELLMHDETRNVLFIADLGADLENLSEHFRGILGAELGGKDKQKDCIDGEGQEGESLRQDEYYRSIGSRLGHFFALVHSSKSLERLQLSSRYSASFLENPGMQDVVFSEAFEPIKDHLLKFPDLLGKDEADQLYQCICENFWRDTPPGQQSICLGDCWTASIMIEPPTHSNTHKPKKTTSNPLAGIRNGEKSSLPKLGVIDWEFASIGRGLDGDIAQLLAHFQQFWIYAHHRGNQRLERVVQALVNGFTASYREHSAAEQASWTRGGGNASAQNVADAATQEAENKQQIGKAQIKLFRSFIISHAAEMINCAFWKDWDCGPNCCRSIPSSLQEVHHENEDTEKSCPTPASDGSTNANTPPSPSSNSSSSRGRAESDSSRGEPPNFKKERCKLIRRFVELALEYLRRAGRNEEDFVRGGGCLKRLISQPLGMGEEVFLPLLQKMR